MSLKKIFISLFFVVGTLTSNSCSTSKLHNLADYKITGFAKRKDINLGGVWDSRFTSFMLQFEDSNGNLAYARILFYLQTVGAIMSWTKNIYRIKFCCSNLTLADFSQQDRSGACRKIKIGRGAMFELAPGLGAGIHIANIKESHGGFILLFSGLTGISMQAGVILGGYFKMSGQPIFIDMDDFCFEGWTGEHNCYDTDYSDLPMTSSESNTPTNISYASTGKR